MCVVSMVMDHFRDGWLPRVEPYLKPSFPGFAPALPITNPITQQEVDEFRRLLERARKYDKEHSEPDCEIEGKKEIIRQIAKLFLLDVSFIDEVEA